MAKLSRDAIRKLLVEAGFKETGGDTSTMVAIAFAESGGETTAHNNKPPDDSYGLWQINMLGSMGPARRKQFGITKNTELFDPRINAKAAKMIYDSQGLKAWTTYTRGTYLKFTDGTTETEGGGGNPLEAVDPTNGISGAVNAFGDTVFKGVSNIAGILVAITLVVLGAVFLLRNTLPIGKVAKVAKAVSK